MAMTIPKFSVKYGASDKVFGGKSAKATLTSTCLNQGQSASKSDCVIVDEFNANWNVRDFVNLPDVTKAVSNLDVKKIERMRSVDSLLKELKLDGILELADYAELNTQRWVRGHLLAQKLGGSGKSENLVPLDRNKNAVMEKFESALYNFFKDAKKAEKIPSNRHYVRVELTIKADGQMSPWFGNCTDKVRRKLGKLPEKITYRMKTEYIDAKSGKAQAGPPNRTYPKPIKAPGPLKL